MRYMIGSILGSLIFFLVPQTTFSEQADAIEKRREQLQKILQNPETIVAKPHLFYDDSPATDLATPASLPGYSKDPKTERLYETAMQDYYRYRSQGLQHRRAVFQWQLFSAKLIFVIVLVLVACGIVFAAIQFRQGMQHKSQEAIANTHVATELELSTKGIKINSPVLGVIILFISLAFFYLYLVHVYPVENIF